MSKKVSNNKTVENSKNNDEGGAFDWVSDNATPLIVGAAVAVGTICIYNYFTNDDDDTDSDNSFISNVTDLLR